MRQILCTLALVAAPMVAPSAAMAHETHQGRTHALIEPGAFDSTPPQAEYEGHFLQGHVHHGEAHHGGGHLNANAVFKTTGFVYLDPKAESFVILVEPNLVNRDTARATAAPLAQFYCSQVFGATEVRFGKVKRHAPERIEAWMFQGTCR